MTQFFRKKSLKNDRPFMFMLRWILFFFFITPTLSLYAQSVPQEFDYKSEMVHMVFVLIGVIILLVILSKITQKLFQKRWTFANKSSHIKILDRRAVSQKSMLYLIEVAGKGFLIGESASSGLESLGTVSLELLEEGGENSDAKKAPKRFDEIMQKLVKKS